MLEATSIPAELIEAESIEAELIETESIVVASRQAGPMKAGSDPMASGYYE